MNCLESAKLVFKLGKKGLGGKLGGILSPVSNDAFSYGYVVVGGMSRNELADLRLLEAPAIASHLHFTF